jgi:hypothetical protein
MPDLEALHPNRHGVGVVWVIDFGHQNGVRFHAYPFLGPPSAADQSPEAVLIVRLADHLQVNPALAEQNFRAVMRPSGLLVRVRCLKLTGPVPTAAKYLPKKTHISS